MCDQEIKINNRKEETRYFRGQLLCHDSESLTLDEGAGERLALWYKIAQATRMVARPILQNPWAGDTDICNCFKNSPGDSNVQPQLKASPVPFPHTKGRKATACRPDLASCQCWSSPKAKKGYFTFKWLGGKK